MKILRVNVAPTWAGSLPWMLKVIEVSKNANVIVPLTLEIVKLGEKASLELEKFVIERDKTKKDEAFSNLMAIAKEMDKKTA